MLNDILNLEGAVVLNKEQQKSIKGGGSDPENFYIRNVKATGEFMEYNGGVVACKCTWQVSKDNKNWEDTSGPCPPPETNSCI